MNSESEAEKELSRLPSTEHRGRVVDFGGGHLFRDFGNVNDRLPKMVAHCDTRCTATEAPTQLRRRKSEVRRTTVKGPSEVGLAVVVEDCERKTTVFIFLKRKALKIGSQGLRVLARLHQPRTT